MDSLLSLDAEIFYLLCGASLLMLTLQPFFRRFWWSNFPLLYVFVGIAIALSGLPVLYPLEDEFSAALIERITELIVIISLAGAGIAIDSKPTWRQWRASYMLVLIAMPFSIVCLAYMGMHLFGLSLASAILLGACLAPTDPVLARSVQVDGPGSKESSLKLSLTGEAGLNDGLAFPFVYLAIALTTSSSNFLTVNEFISWLGIDLLYRVSAGLAIGILVGYAVTKLTLSRIGDVQNDAKNSIVFVLALTFLAYGTAEILHGYGFIAVFGAAYVSGSLARENSKDNDSKYAHAIHKGADQLEKILLVLVIIWFGTLIGDGLLISISWREWIFALIAIFLIRPTCSLFALAFLNCSFTEKLKCSFFGIKGIGSIYYLTYAQNQQNFAEIDVLWRTIFLVILLSILIHGFFANFAIEKNETYVSSRDDD